MSQTGRTRRTARIERVGPVSTSSRPARRRSIASAALGALAMVLALLLAPSSAAQIDTEAATIPQLEIAAQDQSLPPHPDFPGLPHWESVQRGGWQGSQTRGLNYAASLAQWLGTPTLQMLVWVEPLNVRPVDPSCSYPYGALYVEDWRAHGALMNVEAPVDAAQRFGQTQPFEVQAVAFGSIPVVATVSLEQPRDADGVFDLVQIDYMTPVWGNAAGGPDGGCNPRAPFGTRPPGAGATNVSFRPLNGEGEPVARGDMRLRVDALRVDGVDLNLAGSCRSDSAALTLGMNDFISWDPAIRQEERPITPPDRRDPIPGSNILTSPFFSLSEGGLLFGDLEIGTFRGCVTTGGDDVSALLTATVSGPGQTVEIRNSGVGEVAIPGSGICPVDVNCHEYFPVPEIPSEAPEGRS